MQSNQIKLKASDEDERLISAIAKRIELKLISQSDAMRFLIGRINSVSPNRIEQVLSEKLHKSKSYLKILN